MKKFNISYDIDLCLSVEEIWPDGDAPENPTVQDVEHVLEECGGVERVIRDWDLISYGDKFHVREVK